MWRGHLQKPILVLPESAGGFALPAMEAEAVDQNITMFKLVASGLILAQVFAVSLIATRLRAVVTSGLGQSVQLFWIAGITSLLHLTILERPAFSELKTFFFFHFLCCRSMNK